MSERTDKIIKYMQHPLAKTRGLEYEEADYLLDCLVYTENALEIAKADPYKGQYHRQFIQARGRADRLEIELDDLHTAHGRLKADYHNKQLELDDANELISRMSGQLDLEILKHMELSNGTQQ